MNQDVLWLTLAGLFLLFVLGCLWALLAPIHPVDPPLHLDGQSRELLGSVSDLPSRDNRSLSLIVAGVVAVSALVFLFFWLWPVYAYFWLNS